MNLLYAKEFLPLLAAFAAGATLQRQESGGKWWDLVNDGKTQWYIMPDDHPSQYRVKT